ncbi:acyltransferase family protein [Nocardiopsis changdeensis]|uniref:Acyltransferase family protein n=1 Tax=Nocardiopsis changdeensis TaxID=2831969 RepID=A0ABX8BG03_9ACTN|nr:MULTISPECIES: acyltransferase family protein [Nocardiopsis]QUX20695.1 acyltransferase family protein [Nocardiopsis changdeensis]QYX36627.1 acyltransferase family protein [Nocardiopsis sp. MT53]
MSLPTGAPAVRSAGVPRLLYLDNLRTALTVLVVLHHAAIAYSNVPRWYYLEPAADPSGMFLDLMLVFDQAFFMGAFFLIAGLFLPGSHDRRGGRGLLGERLLRLGIPLLAWLLLLRPLVTVGEYTAERDAALAEGSALPYWEYYLTSLTPGPMWFVEVLFVFSALYVLWRYLTRGGRGADRPSPEPGRAPGPVAVAGFVLGLGLAGYGWRIWLPMDAGFLGLPTPAYLPQYAALFTVGVLAARRGLPAGLSGKAGRAGFAAAGAAAAAILVLIVGSSGGTEFLGGGTWQSLVMAVSESVLAVGLITGLLVLFRDRLDRQGAFGRFLSEHAFTVYVVHPVVLVALGYAFSVVQAPAVAKFALVAALGLPLCWMLAFPVRALPGARKVL